MIATVEGTLPLTKRDVVDILDIDSDDYSKEAEALITNFACYSQSKTTLSPFILEGYV